MNRRSFFGFFAASLAATVAAPTRAGQPPSDITYFKPKTRRSVERWGGLTAEQVARIDRAFGDVVFYRDETGIRVYDPRLAP